MCACTHYLVFKEPTASAPARQSAQARYTGLPSLAPGVIVGRFQGNLTRLSSESDLVNAFLGSSDHFLEADRKDCRTAQVAEHRGADCLAGFSRTKAHPTCGNPTGCSGSPSAGRQRGVSTHRQSKPRSHPRGTRRPSQRERVSAKVKPLGRKARLPSTRGPGWPSLAIAGSQGASMRRASSRPPRRAAARPTCPAGRHAPAPRFDTTLRLAPCTWIAKRAIELEHRVILSSGRRPSGGATADELPCARARRALPSRAPS